MGPLQVVAVVVVCWGVVAQGGRRGSQDWRRGYRPVPFQPMPQPHSPDRSHRPDLHHTLYSYSMTPAEYHLRNRGPDPVPVPVPQPYLPVRYNLPIEPGFHRGAIEAHPHSPNTIVSQYSSAFPEEDVDYYTPWNQFQRGAVEHVPVEALQYMAEVREEEEEGEDAAFSRSAVEAYPRFPTPYSGGVYDDMMDAVVVDASEALGEKYGWAGIRSSVESRPIWTPAQDPEEANPLPVQLNSRPFGMWSEELLGLGTGMDDASDGESEYKPEHSDLNSIAGGDLLQYQASIRQQNGDYKLLCYYGGWSVYREPPFDFGVKDIDPFSCTHIIYSFAGLKEGELTIISLDTEVDIVKGAYKAMVGLKQLNPNLKVLIAIGGWNEGGKKYSTMASTVTHRKKFIQSVVTFLKEHQFDGLDLDWEYPGATDRGGRYADKKNFADLVDELHTAFRPHGWLLTAAVSPAGFRLQAGYDVKRISQKLDFINVMTYDLRGPWDGKADHHAPISRRTTDTWAFRSLNTQDGIQKWIDLGTPKEKLILGIPFYGRTFTLANPSNTKPGSRATSGGTEGIYTKERGFLAFYELCKREKSGEWTQAKDGVGGPYMTKGNQWIGWDDAVYINKKMQLVKKMGLGGAMMWAIDLDDNTGVCGIKWPLLTAMRRGLGLQSVPSTFLPSVTPSPGPTAGSSPASTTTTTTTTTTTAASMNTEPQQQVDNAGGATPAPSSLTPTTSTAAPSYQCPGPGYFREEHDCATYYLCDESQTAFKFACPAGLAFDLMRRLCNWPQHVRCGRGTSPLRKVRCLSDGLYSDPSDCHMFVWCREGTAQRFYCQHGMFFNPRTGVCLMEGQKHCLPGESLRVNTQPAIGNPQPMTKMASGYKVVCYFTNWAWYRPEPYTFAPEDVDPSLCTHVIYAYASLDSSDLVMRSLDPYLDFEYEYYKRVMNLRNQAPGLKVMLGLGGWIDSDSDKYSRLVNNPKARARFVEHATAVLTVYGFDGLDLAWMFPRCWKMRCSSGPASDVPGFTSLVQELRASFSPRGLLLSAAVSSFKKIIDMSYDVAALSASLDFINVMTYDFHGAWERKTGHVAPLTYREGDLYASQNSDFALKHWVGKGADPNKLIMGIPLYGQTFTLANPAQSGLNAPVVNGGEPGPATLQRGMMAYYEICQAVRTRGWTKVVDATRAIGPFAHKGTQWYSYEDPASVAHKAEYIRTSGYGGAMVWDLSFDDMLNACCREPMPLLRSINRVLRTVTYSEPRPGGGNCAPASRPLTPAPPKRTTTYASDTIGTKFTESHYGEFNLTTGATTPLPPWMTTWGTSRLTSTTEKPVDSATQPQWPPTPPPTTTRPVWPPTTERRTTTTQQTTSGWWEPSTTSTTPRTTTRRPETTTTERMTTTTRQPDSTTSTMEGSGPPSSGKQPGDSCKGPGLLPSPGKCSKYLRCNNGEFVEEICIPGLHWNEVIGACDWPHKANCQSGPAPTRPPPTRPPTTRPPLTRPPLTRPPPTRPPPTRPPLTRPPPRPSQAPTTVRSTTEEQETPVVITTTERTTVTWWWTPPPSTPRPSTRPWWTPTTGRTTTTPITTERYPPPVVTTQRYPPPVVTDSPTPPPTTCNEGEKSSVPGDCTKFQQCIHGTFGLYECPVGLHWNRELKLCDWPDQAKCSGPGNRHPGDVHHRHLGRTSCSNEGQVHPGPQCTARLRCSQGYVTVELCTGGLVWDENVKACKPPSEVPKCSDVILTTKEEALRPAGPAEPAEPEGPSSGSQLDVNMPCVDGTYDHNPSDCKKYMMCVHGKWQEFGCAEMLDWDRNNNRCDWPQTVQCQASGQDDKRPVSSATPAPRPPTEPPYIPAPVTAAPSIPAWSPPPTQSPSVSTGSDLSGDYKVVCYFTNWAWYRQDIGKYTPENIDASQCTHIVYGFAVLDYSNLIIKPHDSWADIDNGFYAKVIALKSAGVKVTIAIGGWNDSAGDKYSRLVNNPAARAKFIVHVIEFIRKHNFDGLDLDWEYPKCWQVDCNKGPISDKANFANWVKELSLAFKPLGLLLSTAVSPSKKVIDAGYDVPAINRYMDWIAVMTYDFHGHWDKKTGHVAPMYHHPQDDYDYFNMDYAIRYWLQKGATKDKLVLGMPMYGQSFTLNDASVNGLNAPASTGGTAGPFTRAKGFLAYYEICHFIQNNGWTVVKDPESRMGPYAYSGNQWVSFDDVETIKRKSQYIREMGLAGGMVWALDLDDFSNRCGQGPHPLMNAIKSILGAPRAPGFIDSKPAPDPERLPIVEGPPKPKKCWNSAIGTIKKMQEHPPIQPEHFLPGIPGVRPPPGVPVCTKKCWDPNAGVIEVEVTKYPSGHSSRVVQRLQSMAVMRQPPGMLECKCWDPNTRGVVGTNSRLDHPPIEPAHFLPEVPGVRPPPGVEVCTRPPGPSAPGPPAPGPPPPGLPAPGLPAPGPPAPGPQGVCWNPHERMNERKVDHPPIEPAHFLPEVPGVRPPVCPPGTKDYPPPADGYKVVCYFTNWAWYRQGEGKYIPEDIHDDLCTHIVYGFAVLNNNNLLIKPHDTWADFDNKFYEKVTKLKAKGVKVLIAIGGWNDSLGGKYSKLVNNPAARKKFIDHVVQFIQKHNFDGLDLDWEYPVCWQVDCNKGPASDKEGFSAWVMELRAAFQPHGLLLSAAVSPSNKVVDMGYDVPLLSQYFDWIAVMTYDYHGQWDKKTGHVSPMYAHPQDDNLAFNTNFTIHYWIEKGAQRHKLVMGMPMYGQSFTLTGASKNGLNQPSIGGGEAGRYTRARGFLAYYEICYKIKSSKWTVVRDPLGTMGPYAYKGTQWIGFDDVETIRYKSEWIKKMGLGGGMIWALDLDDFRNRCGCEAHPLLRTINRVLRPYPSPDPGCPRLEDSGGIPPPDPLNPTTVRTPAPVTWWKPEITVSTSWWQPSKPTTASPWQTSSVSPATRSTDAPTYDKCEEGKYSSHPTDCSKYYICNHGQKQAQECSHGLHWDDTKKMCDWISVVKCTAGSGGMPPPQTTPRYTTRPTTRYPTRPTTRPTTRYPTRPTTQWTPRPTYPVATVESTKAPDAFVPPGTSPTTDTGYKVVCYFTNWAWYRRGIGKYRPEDIDPDLCTHIVYGFAVLDKTNLVIKPHDTWADYDNKFYEKVASYRARGVKVTLAIGGWNDSLGDKYSRLVNNAAARAKFIAHVIQFLMKHNFDGLDLDWEYPVCWQVDCSKGPASDKQGFSAWVRELHEAFKPYGFLLSAAVSPSYKVMEPGYDIPLLSRYFDWIAVMTYDYHGHWDKKTGHVAPMFAHPDDDEPLFNTNSTIHLWLEKGADPKKLIMGMPLYGQSFGLGWKSNGTGLNQHAPQKGSAGQFTRAAGFLAYYEICHKIQSKGFTVVRDPAGRMGPYAYQGKQWFSFDDIHMIRFKSEWIKHMGLGGGMIWALDLDDFRNRCGCEPHPLLRTINRVLRSYSVPDPNCSL